MSRTYRGMERHAAVYRLAVRRRRSRLIAAAMRILSNLFPPDVQGGRYGW